LISTSEGRIRDSTPTALYPANPCLHQQPQRRVPSCGYSGSEEVVEELRRVCKERNLKGKIRVVRSGCLDVCTFGPNMMIWPEGLWYMKVTKEDVPQIVDTT
jgi:hypothetical protein